MSSPWIAWFKKGTRNSRTTARTSASLTSVGRFGSARRGLPAQDGPARGGHFVHLAGPGRVRSGLHKLRIGFRFFGDRDHGVDEMIELLLALRFGRLDHESAVHDEREADRVGMKSVIDQPLGDVAC